MKKILSLFVSILIGYVGDAQLFHQEIQDPADVQSVYVWQIPRTDSIYSVAGKDTLCFISAYTYKGVPVYMLVSPSAYTTIQGYFFESKYRRMSDSLLGSQQYVGYEFAVSYLEKLSYLSRREIRKWDEQRQRTAEAINEKTKYTLMSENPRPVFGHKDDQDHYVVNGTNVVSQNYVPLQHVPPTKKQDVPYVSPH